MPQTVIVGPQVLQWAIGASRPCGREPGSLGSPLPRPSLPWTWESFHGPDCTEINPKRPGSGAHGQGEGPQRAVPRPRSPALSLQRLPVMPRATSATTGPGRGSLQALPPSLLLLPLSLSPLSPSLSLSFPPCPSPPLPPLSHTHTHTHTHPK